MDPEMIWIRIENDLEIIFQIISETLFNRIQILKIILYICNGSGNDLKNDLK